MTDLDPARAILDLSDWGRMYVVMVEDYDPAAPANEGDVIDELERLWMQLFVTGFDQMDASEQGEAIFSLATLLMDHDGLTASRAREAWSVLRIDMEMDETRWDREGPTSAEERQSYRQAIRDRLIDSFPDLDPSGQTHDRKAQERIRDLPDESSGILY